MNHGSGNCFFIDPLFPNFVVYLKINYFFISNMTLFEINKLDNHTFSIPIDSLTINDLFLLFHISTKINNKTIEITAKSVVSLDKFLLDFPDEKITYDYAYLFSHNLVKQLLYLEKRKQTVSAFSISDFLVIDNSFLVFINHKKILDIQDNFIEILTPYNKNSNTFFITKQMKDNQDLPLKLEYKNVYISLAYLIIYMMYGKHNYEHNDNLLLISNLFGTKLYYFLELCLAENEKNRHICLF